MKFQIDLPEIWIRSFTVDAANLEDAKKIAHDIERDDCGYTEDCFEYSHNTEAICRQID